MKDSVKNIMSDPAPQQNQQPIVIKQGGNGLGMVIAAVIIAGAAVYAINVWSTTRKETAPGTNLRQGIEKIKEEVSKSSGLETIKNKVGSAIEAGQ